MHTVLDGKGSGGTIKGESRKGVETMMSNKMYNILKWVAMILLPAIGTLYSALAGIWGFPYAEQIVGTVTAVNMFLGTALTISTTKYNKMKVGK